jgi:hypothetical protein
MDIFEIPHAPVRFLSEHNPVAATGIAPIRELKWGLRDQNVIGLVGQVGVLEEGGALLIISSIQILVMTIHRSINKTLTGLHIPSVVEADIALMEVHCGVDLP